MPRLLGAIVCALATSLVSIAPPVAAADEPQGPPVRTTIRDVRQQPLASGAPALLSYVATHQFDGPMSSGDVLPGARIARQDHPGAFEGLYGQIGTMSAWLAQPGMLQFDPTATLTEDAWFENSISPFDQSSVAAGDMAEVGAVPIPYTAAVPWDRTRGAATGALEWDVAVDQRQLTARYGGVEGAMDAVMIRAHVVARGGDVDARTEPVRTPLLEIDIPQAALTEVVGGSHASWFTPYTNYIKDVEFRVFPALGKAVLSAVVQGYIPEARERTVGRAGLTEWHIPFNAIALVPREAGSQETRTVTHLPSGGMVVPAALPGSAAPEPVALPPGGRVFLGGDAPVVISDRERSDDGSGASPSEVSAAEGGSWLTDEIAVASEIDHRSTQPVQLVNKRSGYSLTLEPDHRGSGVLAVRAARWDRATQPYVETNAVPFVRLDGQDIALVRDRLVDLHVRLDKRGIGVTFTGGGQNEQFRRIRMSGGSAFDPGLTIRAAYRLTDDAYAFVTFETGPSSFFAGGLLSTAVEVRRLSGAPVTAQAVQLVELPAGEGPLRNASQDRTTEFTSSSVFVTVGDRSINHSAGTLTAVRAPASLFAVPAPDESISIEGEAVALYFVPAAPAQAVPRATTGLMAWVTAVPLWPDPDPMPLGDSSCGEPQIRGDGEATKHPHLEIKEAWFDADGARIYATVRVADLPETAPSLTTYMWRVVWRYEHRARYVEARLGSTGTWSFEGGALSDLGFLPRPGVTGEAAPGPDGVVRVSVPRNMFENLRDGEWLRDTSAHAYHRSSAGTVRMDRAPAGTGLDYGSGGDYVIDSSCPRPDPDPTPDPTPDPGGTRPGGTRTASMGTEGTPGNGHTGSAAISADGRYVAFHSQATNLGAGPTTGRIQVYVRDLHTGVIEMVSVSESGASGNGDSQFPDISADGRIVAFSSAATNLVAGDTNGQRDVFVHDRATGETRRVSVTNGGGQVSGSSSQNAVSADGRVVVFSSSAPELLAGAPTNQVFLHDLEADTTEMVSVAHDGEVADRISQQPAVSADGDHVAFMSRATNLIAEGASDIYDIYVRDREAGTTERVSVGWDGREASGASNFAAISADGQTVAFASSAPNLVPLDDNQTGDVFVHDRGTRTTERVSVASSGAQTLAGALDPAISSDGRLIVFESVARDLDEDAGAANDVYLHDRATGATRVVSLTDDGDPIEIDATSAAISGDGRHVAFTMHKAVLLPGDSEVTRQVLVRDAGQPTGLFDITVDRSEDSLQVEGRVTFAGDVIASGAPTGPSRQGSRDLGGELTGASVTYRPERGDLLFRWDLAHLDPVHPGVTYAFRLQAGGSIYRVHAAFPLRDYRLHRCDPACVPIADLSGGLGETGADVRVALPLALVGLEEGDPITGLSATTEPRHPGGGTIVFFHEVALSDTEVPRREVRLGLATRGTLPNEVDREAADTPTEWSFTADLDVSDLAPGDYDLWTHTCLGDSCVIEATPVILEGDEAGKLLTLVALTERSSISGQYSDETLLEARLTDHEGAPLAGVGVVFELVGEGSARSFTATTDDDGVASVTPTLNERPGPYQLTVRYAGDGDHAPSANATAFVVDKEDSTLELTVEGKGNNRTLTARLADEDTPGDGIAGRTVDFYGDGEHVGSATTNDDGIAALKAPPRYRGGKHDFEARFDGDAYYIGSSDGEQT